MFILHRHYIAAYIAVDRVVNVIYFSNIRHTLLLILQYVSLFAFDIITIFLQ